MVNTLRILFIRNHFVALRSSCEESEDCLSKSSTSQILNGPSRISGQHLNFRIDEECDKLMIIKNDHKTKLCLFFIFYTIINFSSFWARFWVREKMKEKYVNFDHSPHQLNKLSLLWTALLAGWGVVYESSSTTCSYVPISKQYDATSEHLPRSIFLNIFHSSPIWRIIILARVQHVTFVWKWKSLLIKRKKFSTVIQSHWLSPGI